MYGKHNKMKNKENKSCFAFNRRKSVRQVWNNMIMNDPFN